ncbi:MAG: hypothetical protein WC868_07535 [Bacteroidales bacterium]
MNSFEDCEKIKTDRYIVLHEKKSKITFVNKARLKVRKILIDGCVIKNNEIRCDYLVIRQPDEEIYVELKGSDVSHAIKQIENTIVKVSHNAKSLDKYCFIISTRCPLISPEIQNHKLYFKRRYNSFLIIKNSPYEFILS